MSDPVTSLLDLSGSLCSIFRTLTASMSGLVLQVGWLAGQPNIAGTAFTLMILVNVSPWSQVHPRIAGEMLLPQESLAPEFS